MKFWWEAKHKVPANAKAVIASPSIVADRYIQLTPAYSKGDVMADGAEIPLDRTAVPLELDQIYQSLNDLAVALGPKGANDQGALSRLLDVCAENLNGQGQQAEPDHHRRVEADRHAGDNRRPVLHDPAVADVRVRTGRERRPVRQFNNNFAATSTSWPVSARTWRRRCRSWRPRSARSRRSSRTTGRNDHGQLRPRRRTILVKEKAALTEVLDTARSAWATCARSTTRSSDAGPAINAAQLDDPATFICSLLTADRPAGGVCDRSSTPCRS